MDLSEGSDVKDLEDLQLCRGGDVSCEVNSVLLSIPVKGRYL